MAPRDVEPVSTRRRYPRGLALRRAKRPIHHDPCPGDGCFECLVAKYAQSVVVHKPVFPPQVKHGAKPRRT